MVIPKRYRRRWNMNEVNRLHNEYEIKQLPILQIAKLHERGQFAILHKLSSEGLIHETWRDVRGWKNLSDIYSDADECECDDDDSEDDSEDEYNDEESEEESDEDDDEYETEFEYEENHKQKPTFFQSIITTIKLFITSALS